jgi:hypothetical protein
MARGVVPLLTLLLFGKMSNYLRYAKEFIFIARSYCLKSNNSRQLKLPPLHWANASMK